MEVDALIEWTLERALAGADDTHSPPSLRAAVRHAVFPGGARVRPQLCLAVARSCAPEADLSPATGVAAAIELLHCASLVHDDLPCFDGADTRRGKPSVHITYGEPIALLAGDALIVTAFSALADGFARAPDRMVELTRILVESVGMPHGIVAGQAWESEETVNLKTYHRSKTGALFVGAAMGGAAAMQCDPAPWKALGERLGEAYQVADDLRDMAMDGDALGKPAGQDIRLGRPSAVASYGVSGALNRLETLVSAAVDSIPDCDGSDGLRQLVRAQAARLIPTPLAAAASA
ncbi:MAG: polyprenyl synthetase family protein [Pseudomonadota bacterium]